MRSLYRYAQGAASHPSRRENRNVRQAQSFLCENFRSKIGERLKGLAAQLG
jgi:hypothetical protein